MDRRGTRPATVWLTQALLVIFSLLLIGLAAFDAVLLCGFHRGGAGASLVVLGVIIPLGFALLPLLACWGLARRKLYGRYLGLLSLTLLWAILLFVQVRRAPGLLLYYEDRPPAQLIGGVALCLFIHGLFLALILRLAFSKRVGMFFDNGA
jgi:hypothetical protein